MCDSASSRLRFGPFEFDPATGELRRGNEHVGLQDQPSRLLAILVEHAGEVVSRDDLQRQLWPTGTFVEFDHGLNTAVKKLRQALDDRPESPVFIETVPRHGYRFIGKVERVQFADETLQPGQQHHHGVAVSRMVRAVLICAVILVGFAFVWRSRRTVGTTHLVMNAVRLTADPGLSWQPAISQDGHLVVFSSDRADQHNLDLWVKQADGGDPVRLTSGAADEVEPDFCPDGRVVFRSDGPAGGVYIVPALGGSPIMLAPGGRDPKCSPDGTAVAFWVGTPTGLQSAVYTVSTSGGEPVRRAPQLDRCLRPLWSADSKKLLVFGYSDRGTPWNQAEWFIVPLGTEPLRKVNIRASLASGFDFPDRAPIPLAWIPATNEVLFSASKDQPDYATTRSSLWALTINPDTAEIVGDVRPMTTSTGLHDSPSVARTGRVVFSSLELNPDIWAAPINAGTAVLEGELQPVTREKYWESRPSVSSDESTFVFRTDRGGGWDFWALDLRSNQARPVTISRTVKVFAALRRDNKSIAWHEGAAVHAAELQTGTTRQLCVDCGAEPSDWTASGDVLVTLRASDAIGLMSPRDGAIRQILRPVATTLGGAAMSPDDRWIAFESLESADAASTQGRIMVAPASQTPIRRELWIEVSRTGSLPKWSPDGRSLYFLSQVDGWNCVWAARFDPTTGKLVRAASAFMHFHRQNRPLLGSYAVSSKHLFVGLHERVGNLWISGADGH